MRFRQYSDNMATLNEWGRQLNVVSHACYPLYSTEENTLNHWKDTLNRVVGVNTFGLNSTPEETLLNWQDKLNGIYNR